MKADTIRSLLPEIYRGPDRPDTLLMGFLAVMEELHARPEAILASYRQCLDPLDPASVPHLPFLAQWLDLDIIDPGSFLEQRGLSNLVLHAMDLHRLRGTTDGLLFALRLATGCSEFSIEEGSGPTGPDPFHLTVVAPAALSEQELLVVRILTLYKPAHATFSLVYRDSPASGESS